MGMFYNVVVGSMATYVLCGKVVIMVKVRKKLDGLRFGKLEVVEQAEDYVSPKGRHDANWLCKCDCGNYIVVRGSDLKSKRTKSCGCCNVYDLSGEYGVCTMSNGRQFFFDLEDYDLISQYCWCEKTDNHYIQANVEGKKVYLHRLLMNPNKGYVVDHINLLKYDNRKSNLRICTQHQNNMNMPIKSTNTSGYTGIRKRKNKYQARITINGKEVSLGCYDNFDDAVKARKKAEEKYFGEYAYDATDKLA